MNPTRRVLSLAAVAGALGLWAPSVARAQTPSPREQFLRLLLLYRDQEIVDALERRRELVDRRLARVEALTPTNPREVGQIAQARVRLEWQAQYWGLRIASPPVSPLRIELMQQNRELVREELWIDRRIWQLERLAAVRPRLRFRLVRLEERLALQGQQVGAEIQQIETTLAASSARAPGATLERAVATPFAPTNPVSFFSFGY